MEKLVVCGGSPLFGTVEIHGAKNGILPILAATLLTHERCVLTGCPDLTDVSAALQILDSLHCKTEKTGGAVIIDSQNAKLCDIQPELAGKLRASLTFVGAMLAGFGRGAIALPGGCCLGGRPIDYHLQALKKMGVKFDCDSEMLRFSWEEKRGGFITLPYPSVGATENILLAACAVPEPVTVRGAAREPEIRELCRFLTAAGIKICGIGTDVLTVFGGEKMHGAAFHILPDRMEAATYLSMAAACGGRITLKNVRQEHLCAVISALREAGCKIICEEKEITLERSGELFPVKITTDTYPDFPTDAQAPLMAAVLTANGESHITETVFPKRFAHVPQFRKFGAQISVQGREVTVFGVPQLYAAQAEAPDLRGGAGVLIAALCAAGKSEIAGADCMRRGYADFISQLRRLGAALYAEKS